MSEYRQVSSKKPIDAESVTYVCWSRMQAEAGQHLDAIIVRKERERRAGNGLFLWGVGNAPSTSIKGLARLKIPVRVIFSAMKSKPKPVDLAPGRTVVWRTYLDQFGIEQPLPAGALVTSRGDSVGGEKTRHYALMCFSEAPLALRRGIPFDPSAYRNASGLGAPVGSSQVTALLRQVAEPAATSAYEANVVARLTGGYWVRLSEPQQLSSQAITEIADFDGDTNQWLDFTERLRRKRAAYSRTEKRKELFF